jgi:Cu/Ag efflux pump CusA
MDAKTLEKKDFEDAIITKEWIHVAVVHGAMVRLRPVLMTAFTSVIWLFPMIWSSWTWAELQKPLAIVVVWGLVTSIALTLIVLPILFSYLREKKVNT